MENRITKQQDDLRRREEGRGPKPISEILVELLAQYQIRFPQARITVVETPAY